MVQLNFQPRFVDPIRRGLKRQTIRKERRRDPRVGEALQLYVGLRTPRASKILETDPRCVGVHPIRMAIAQRPKVSALPSMVWFERSLPVWMEEEGFRRDEGGEDFFIIDEGFARRDGFDTLEDMEVFWTEQHGATHGRDEFGRILFTGNVIEW